MKTKKIKTQKLKKTKKKTSIKQNISIRIIIIDTEKNECKNDMTVFIDLFKKLGYKVDTHTMDINPKLRINYAPNPYYDINLFIDRIVPSEFKTIFPSGVNIVMVNMNTFQNYKELKDIDSVLCNTKQCYNFINLIKKENSKKYNYTFKTYYTKFTTPIPQHLLTIRKNSSTMTKTMTKTKPMIFIHSANNQKFKNTGSLIHCWLKYNSNSNNTLDCELHVLCHGLCMTTLLLDIKKMYHYDLLTTYTFVKEHYKNKVNQSSTIILKYKNLYLYLDLTPHDTIYKELINNADVSLYPSKKENYPHSLNTARFFNLFTITLNHQSMNELITRSKDNSNGYLLYKSKLKKHITQKQNCLL